jgi:hypothetical protein
LDPLQTLGGVREGEREHRSGFDSFLRLFCRVVDGVADCHDALGIEVRRGCSRADEVIE